MTIERRIIGYSQSKTRQRVTGAAGRCQPAIGEPPRFSCLDTDRGPRHNEGMGRLTREQIVEALERLDRAIGDYGTRAQLYLVGGAVMCLALETRTSTRDVDGWFTEPQIVRRAAARVAREMGLDEDWLNDAAKGFAPQDGGFEAWRSFPNLDVLVADERTLLAMKCAAARTAEDAGDIRILSERLGLTRSNDVLDLVLAYYPADHLPVRTRLLLEEMLDVAQDSNDGG